MVLDRRTLIFALSGCVPATALAAPMTLNGTLLPGAGLGLSPDTGADVTVKLADAALSAARRGAVLSLEPGIYVVSGLNLPAGARITGHGAVLSAAGGASAIDTKGSAGIALDGVTVRGSGTQANGKGLVTFSDVERLLVSSCVIEGSGAAGLSLNGSTGRVRDCQITHCRDAAIFAVDCREIEIDGNEIAQCDDNGILVWQSEKRFDGARITGNRISKIGAVSGGSGQYGNGINIYRAGGTIVSGNHISDCAFTAVRVNSGDNCQIIGNNCARMGEVALYVEFAFEGAIVANNIVDTAGMGISVTNFGNAGGRLAVVSGNLVRNLFTPAYEEARGVGIGVEADTAVTGNVVENAALFGIVAGWGAAMRDVTINGNVVRGSPVGIAVSVSPGAGHAAITGNRIEGASKSAIQAMDHNDLIDGDMVARGAKIDPRLMVSGNSAG